MGDLEGLVSLVQVGYFVVPTGLGAIIGAIAGGSGRGRGALIGGLAGLLVGAGAFVVMAAW